MSLSSATPDRANSGQNIYFGTAAPATADAYGLTFNVGDIVVNTSPANGPAGWVCITAGSPGSWQQLAASLVDTVYSMHSNGSLATTSFFGIASGTMAIVAAFEIHGTAGTDSGTVSVDVFMDASGSAPGSGASILAAPFNAKGTANTWQTGTLATTTLTAGSRLTVKFTGTLTALADVLVKVVLQRI